MAPRDDSVGMEIHGEKLIAEALGAFILVFFGCGPVVFMGGRYRPPPPMRWAIKAPAAMAGPAIGLTLAGPTKSVCGRGVPCRSTHFLFASCRDLVKTRTLSARISGF